MTITILAAVARNGVIGVAGDLPWKISEDLKRVKRLTTGHVLVMGRRTYESIGRPLPGRSTVVVTRHPAWSAEGVHVAASVPDALRLAASLDDEIFVFGGADIYAQTLDLAHRLELTEVQDAPEGDTYFPAVDWSQWREVTRERHDGFDFVTYERDTTPRASAPAT
ncbi:dihydrofolate reductase [Actinobacteria bacterium YIM 96077]|uniref:Dihydrofolate reductase n=1 Tax=Phytoactinopolyspora halophila TaxID=1981511 RepID=A0A329QVF8_9ACTN|nr:dihydrofolate reductase [Phytoactinopolyspora halophila]AYY12796.1 dihydrofolate reductase [Actinobacteria bacterium YIM 96077]RAW16410.1 dihydrofolate reductase [Phytoactinopolyspora halophila]